MRKIRTAVIVDLISYIPVLKVSVEENGKSEIIDSVDLEPNISKEILDSRLDENYVKFINKLLKKKNQEPMSEDEIRFFLSHQLSLQKDASNEDLQKLAGVK